MERTRRVCREIPTDSLKFVTLRRQQRETTVGRVCQSCQVSNKKKDETIAEQLKEINELKSKLKKLTQVNNSFTEILKEK